MTSCQESRKDLVQLSVPLAAFAFAMAAILLVGRSTVSFPDAPDYLAAADSIVEGNGYPRQSSLPFFRPPLYPFMISCVWQLAPGSIWAVKLAQAALFTFTCWLLYRIGLLATRDRLAAFLGSLVYTVNPFALRQVADIQTESLHSLLIALGVFGMVRGVVKAGRAGWPFFLAGITFGLAALCRPTGLPVGLGLALVVLPLLWNQTGLRRVTAGAGLVTLGLAVSIGPWTWLNWRATGEFIPITDAGGYHLWLGNHPDELLVYRQTFATADEFAAYSGGYMQHDLPGAMMAKWERTTGYRELGLRQREQLWQDEAFRNMREWPAMTAALIGEKTIAYWRPWLQRGAYPNPLVWASGLGLTALYLFALVGGWMLRRFNPGRQVLWIFVGLFLASTLVHALVHSMIRFRLPYVDPYLGVLAGVFGAKLVRAVRKAPQAAISAPMAAAA